MQINKIDIYKLIAKVKVAYPFNYKTFEVDDFEILAESWYEDLGGYSLELVNEAFKRARQANKISITTADIIEQIEKIRSAFEPSEQELWQELIAVLNKAQWCIDRFNYTYIEENGKTQGENAREQLAALYRGLKPEFKRYCGGTSGLIELAEMDDESLEFERPRFLKDIKRKQEQVRTQEQYPALGEMVKIKGLLEG